MTAVLNAANEVAVENFLGGRLPFLAIAAVVEETMAKHRNLPNPSLEDILEADRWAREQTNQAVGKVAHVL